jgi:tetratricopeptide (TPR) repeat protein/TolB-like protein
MNKRQAPLLLMVLALPGVGWAQATSPETRTILVFPFENASGRADLAWISEGFADLLSTRLAAPSRYVLGREERDAACEQLEIPPESALTLATEYKAAETLGVDWAVVGNFTVEGSRLTAHARLLDVHHLKLAPVLEATGELDDFVDVDTNLAWRILATHDPNFTTGKEEDFTRRFAPVRLDAFENYIRGTLTTDGEARVKFLREADRLDPANHRAALQLGQWYFDQKDYAESEKWLARLVAGDGDYLESLFLRGVDAYFLGREAAAEKDFTTLAQQIPLNEVVNNVGVMMERRGRHEEALQNFQRAAQADPSDPDFAFNAAVSLWHLKRYSEAAKYLDQALSLDNDDDAAHALLALVDQKLGDYAGARREQQWLAQHEADSESQGAAVPASDIIPQTRLKKHYDGRAFGLLALAVRNALEARLSTLPPAEHAEVHLTQGQKFLNEDRLAEAERELTEAISLAPDSSVAHLTLGEVYELENRHRDATSELETSLQIKNDVIAHVWLARADLALNQTQAARRESQAALDLDPHNRYAERVMEQVRGREAGKKHEAD